MKRIVVRRAQDSGPSDPVESVLIEIGPVFDVPLRDTTLPLDFSRHERAFHEDAQAVETALHHHLPGGTYCQLLALMLQRRASHFVVSFGGDT